jgi:hypothetical protein
MMPEEAQADIGRAPGVEYKTIPGCEREFFRCDRHAATLSTAACTAMYREANHTDVGQLGNRLFRCRSCPIGASHAREEVAIFSALFGSDICPRCGKGTTRMIQGRICVSCRNREYELLRGRNAKGTAPVKLRPLFPINLKFMVNGKQRTYYAPMATDITETMVQVLRLTKGRITFGFQADPSVIKQGESI